MEFSPNVVDYDNNPTNAPANSTFQVSFNGTTFSFTVPFTEEMMTRAIEEKLPFIMAHVVGLSTSLLFLVAIGAIAFSCWRYPSEFILIYTNDNV